MRVANITHICVLAVRPVESLESPERVNCGGLCTVMNVVIAARAAGVGSSTASSVLNQSLRGPPNSNTRRAKCLYSSEPGA